MLINKKEPNNDRASNSWMVIDDRPLDRLIWLDHRGEAKWEGGSHHVCL